MIFTRRFFILFALGVLPLIFAWGAPAIKWGLIAYDLILLFIDYVDYRRTENISQIEIARHMPRRFMIGAENEVQITISHRLPRRFSLTIKDEYPPGLELRGERLLVATPRRRGTPERQATVGYKLYAASRGDRKCTRLNSSHVANWYAVFCLKKRINTYLVLIQKNKKKHIKQHRRP